MDFETELRAVLDGYLAVYTAADAAGCADYYHSDGRIDSPFGPPAIGRETIRATHCSWFGARERNKRLEVLQAGARDGLGYALLRYSADTPDGPDAGISLNVLERDAGGNWRIRLSSLTPDFDETSGKSDTP